MAKNRAISGTTMCCFIPWKNVIIIISFTWFNEAYNDVYHISFCSPGIQCAVSRQLSPNLTCGVSKDVSVVSDLDTLVKTESSSSPQRTTPGVLISSKSTSFLSLPAVSHSADTHFLHASARFLIFHSNITPPLLLSLTFFLLSDPPQSLSL